MKKKIFAVLLAVLVCFSSVLCAYATQAQTDRTVPLIIDEAELLTDDEENALNQKLEVFVQEHSIELYILTVNSLEGKTAEAYADDFYDEHNLGIGETHDGILVLYKPGAEGEREIHISTSGKAMEEFDYSIDIFLDNMTDYLIAEDYVGAFISYVDTADMIITPYVSVFTLVICLGVGVLIGLLITNIIASKNKSVFSQRAATVYSRPGSMVVTNQIDNFRTTTLNRTKKPTNNSSSSGTHTSSSGRTHGGGGRKF